MGSRRGGDSGRIKPEIQYNTIKVPLYPTPEQKELFQKTFGCCRYIWNRMLSDQERFYLETDKHFIPTPAKYKNEAPFLREASSGIPRPSATRSSSGKRTTGTASPPAISFLPAAPPSTSRETPSV